ncbi:GNAT family N-acetyltransferase [Sphingomonas melonis]|uniref:Acetyltransferase n=1 Tax=Sphingomonas melonis TaxID=152682 RepID=A0A7Y9FLD4_9SPHN|nr:GNAT family N-acetyltransferase [Sphingomonas melonis]NYD89248.1 hypothetical protein [Sphingomonas melonis]
MAGEAYTLDHDMGAAALADYGFGDDKAVFVAETEGRDARQLLFSHQSGGWRRVSPVPPMSPRGIARATARHSFDAAGAAGFPAMQFNFNMASNHVAVTLWQALGFAIVARPPRALYHPLPGPIDALVMPRWLVDPAAARNA